jgi:diguanylate cyclase (GGDEF)-like protein/PAS domain S-box-containing protein
MENLMVFLKQMLNGALGSFGQTNILENLAYFLESDVLGAFLLVNQSGTILVASQAARRVIRVASTEAISLNIFNLLTDQCRSHWQFLHTHQENKQPQPIEWKDVLQTLDNSTIPIEVRATWLANGLYLLHFAERVEDLDVSLVPQTIRRRIAGLEESLERYRWQEEELKRTERLYRNAFNHTFQLSSLLTPEGVVLEDNQTALDFCSLTREDLVDTLFVDLHCWQISSAVKQNVEVAIAQAAQGKTVRFETDIWDPDHNVMTIDFSVKPCLDEAGSIEFLIAEGRDITARKQAELALKASEARFRSTLENIPLSGVILDQQANIIFANKFFLELTGWQQDDVLNQNWFDWFVPEAKRDEVYRQTFTAALQDDAASAHYEYAILTRWGEQRLISWRITVLAGLTHSMLELACVGEDITERRRGERNLQQQAVQEQLLADITHQVRQSLDLDTILKTAVNQIQQALNAEQVLVFQIDPDGEGQTVAYSESTYGTGWSLGSPFSQLRNKRSVSLTANEPQMVDAPIVRRSDDGKLQVWGLLIVHLNGPINDFIEVEWFLRQLADQLAVAIHQSELYQRAQNELMSRQQAMDRFRHDALHDSLTGLPNYPCLLQHLNDLIPLESSVHPNAEFAVLFLDLDNFKAINDNFGHSIGDQLLTVVAQRLRTCIRETDLVARRSGDEFLFLLHPIDGPKEAVEVARRVEQALAQPISFEHQRLEVQGSIGIVIGPQHYTDAEAMLQDADAAMYEAKRRETSYCLWPHTA